MITKQTSTLACLLAASILLFSGVASAQEDASDGTTGHFGVDVLLGWGFKDDPNPYKSGVGVRAGYYMANRISIAGTYIYHFGHSEEETFGNEPADVKYRMSVAGIEGGYLLPLPMIAVRPYLGAGLGMYRSTYLGQSDTSNKLTFWPGVDVGIPVGPFNVGLEARYYIVTGLDDIPETQTNESTAANAFAMYGGFTFTF